MREILMDRCRQSCHPLLSVIASHRKGFRRRINRRERPRAGDERIFLDDALVHFYAETRDDLGSDVLIAWNLAKSALGATIFGRASEEARAHTIRVVLGFTVP